MPIPRIGVKWPRAGLRYLIRQTATLGSLNSRQQEILVTVDTAANISVWNIANPLTPANVDVGESETFYSAGGIVFWMLQVGDYVPPANDDTRCNLIAQVGWTATQVRDGFIAQINAYAKEMRNLTNRYYDTLRALPGTAADTFRLLMPIGTVGGTTHLTNTGPAAIDAVLTFNGFVLPLAYGIIGPRRHVFGVDFPYPPERPG